MAKVKRSARLVRYTRQIGLRVEPAVFEAFLAVCEPNENLAEAARRVFEIGLTTLHRAAENAEARWKAAPWNA